MRYGTCVWRRALWETELSWPNSQSQAANSAAVSCGGIQWPSSGPFTSLGLPPLPGSEWLHVGAQKPSAHRSRQRLTGQSQTVAVL